MTYAIVYSSKTGNTLQLAEQIRQTLGTEDCIYFGAPDETALTAERIYAGFWTDKGSCNRETADFLKTLTDQEVFLFGTAGFGGSAEYYDKILHRVSGHLGKGVRLVGHYMCQGKMPMSVRDRYEKMLAQPVHMPNLQSMIENFDRALPHPDAEDLNALRQAVTSV